MAWSYLLPCKFKLKTEISVFKYLHRKKTLNFAPRNAAIRVLSTTFHSLFFYHYYWNKPQYLRLEDRVYCFYLSSVSRRPFLFYVIIFFSLVVCSLLISFTVLFSRFCKKESKIQVHVCRTEQHLFKFYLQYWPAG